ncbi:urea transporter, partial [Staphylococcus pseudintermedius]
VTFRSSNHLKAEIAVVLTLVMTPMMYAATATFLEPIRIPSLTFPFIITTLLLLLAAQSTT